MASDKLSRDPGQGGEEPTEAVRIIAAEELEEAAERREVARRRAPDEPGYKDRPPAPPADVQPAIRFPLPDSADIASLERPRPQPVDPPRAEGSVPDRPERPEPPVEPAAEELTEAEAIGEGVGEVSPVALDERGAAGEQAPASSADDATAVHPVISAETVGAPAPPEPSTAERAGEAEPEPAAGHAGPEPEIDLRERDRAGEVVVAEAPEPVPDAVAGAVAEHSGAGEAPSEAPDPSASSAEPQGGAAPVLDLGPSTGEHALPHWTEPPTGEVPKVVIGDAEETGEDERWATFAANAPRWRDEHDTSEHGDLMADLAGLDDEQTEERLGALDTSERLSEEAYLNFDDVELDPRRRGRRGSRRGRARAERPPAPDPLAAIVTDAGLPPSGSEAVVGPVPPGPVLPTPTVGAPRPPAEPAAAAPAEPRARVGPARPRLTGSLPPPDDDPAAPRRRRHAAPLEPERSSGGRNVPQAVAVGAGLALLALLVFKAGPAPTMVLVEIIIALAGAEFYGAVQRGGFRPATLLGLTAVAALPVATYWKGEAAFPLVLFLAFVVGVLWYLLGVGGKVRPTANLGVTMVGIVWVGVLGSFAALILKIPSQGVSILLVAVVAAVAHDVGGFFIGRSMGRTPLSAISPHKTVEGLLGGIVAALVGVFLVAVVLGVGPFSSGQALVFGLCTALVAPLGDLAESLFKRDLGLKDMGSLLPQHGGLLDRFDGMLFVLPVAYYVARAFNLAG